MKNGSATLNQPQIASLKSSLNLLREITEKTYNQEIAPIALAKWEKHLSPDNPLWRFITAKSFSISNKAHVIAFIDPRLPGLGLVGFFGCRDIDSGAQVLIKACKWLKQQGIEKVYGPIDGTITKDYRLNLSEDFRVPGEPVNPLFYNDAFYEAGFSVFNRYVSGLTKHYRLFSKLFIRTPSDKYAHLTLLSFSKNKPLDNLKIYHKLMNLIFPSQSLYCPLISWEERLYNMADKEPFFDSNYSYFLEDDGKPVGMIVAHVFDNKLCIDVLGILPEYRGHHVSGLLIHKVHEQASQERLEAAIYALIRVGNQVYSKKRPGVKTYRQYVTMCKQI